MSLPNEDITSFYISIMINIKYLVVLDVGDKLTFIPEELPPS
jgi:hypothetical protein